MAEHANGTGRGRRIAVTGATGNVGTALLRRLVADDRVERIVGIAKRRPDLDLPRVDWATADVGRDDLTTALAGCDSVVHLAWQFQPTRDPAETWQANAVGSRRVFDAAAAAGAEVLIHASSVGTYSAAPGRTVTEAWPTDAFPGACYSREKGYVERVLDTVELAHPELRVVRMRPAFIFQRSASTAQRRIFLGPLLPRGLLEPGRLPLLPLPAGLAFQALHADDAALGYHRALFRDVRGAFNLAAEGVVDAEALGERLGTRTVAVPRLVVRSAMALAWRARAIPAEPALFDLVSRLPLLDTSRARTELGWAPRLTAVDAVEEVLDGIRRGAGGATPPLAPDSAAGRAAEVATGVGAAY